MLQRTGFARKVYTPPPAAPLLALVRRPSYAGSGVVVALPKMQIVRSEPYRRLVAALPCLKCGREGYSQAAHARASARFIRNCRNRGGFMKLSIETNFRDVARKLQTLQKDIATKATASALNKTVAQAKTQMQREITREFNIKAAEVREKLRIRKATARGGLVQIEAVLEATGKGGRSRGMNLIRFLERSTSLAQARKRGKVGTQNQLHVQIKRTGGKKALGSAFIANKGRTVFVREGKSRLPIKALTTIDVQQMFNTKRINAVVVKAIEDRFPKIFDNEVKFYTDRFNREQG